MVDRSDGLDLGKGWMFQESTAGEVVSRAFKRAGGERLCPQVVKGTMVKNTSSVQSWIDLTSHGSSRKGFGLSG